MFPEKNGVRPVTLHGDLVSVTEQRVNGRRCSMQIWTGPSSDVAATDGWQHSAVDRRESTRGQGKARRGVTRLPHRLDQDPAWPGVGGGWVGVRFPMTWGDSSMRCARRGG